VQYGRETIPNGQYLLEYGFVLGEHESDSIFISAPEFSGDPLYNEKMKVFEKNQVDLNRILLGKSDQQSRELLNCVKVMQMNEHEFAAFKASPNLDKVSLRTEKAAIRVSLNHLKKILKAYGTTIQVKSPPLYFLTIFIFFFFCCFHQLLSKLVCSRKTKPFCPAAKGEA
jgi:hypothetical protein